MARTLNSTEGFRWAPAGVVAVAVVVLPLAVGLRLVRSRSVVYIADLHETLLAATAASGGRQWVGAWSRLGLYHPGPMWFSWASPFLLVSEGQPSGLFLGAAALVSVTAVGVVIVVARAEGPVTAACVALTVLMGLHQLGLAGLLAPWNPTVLIVPTALGIVAVASALARGSLVSATVGVLCGTFLAQAHLGAVPLGALLVSLALGGWVWARRRDEPESAGRQWQCSSRWPQPRGFRW